MSGQGCNFGDCRNALRRNAVFEHRVDARLLAAELFCQPLLGLAIVLKPLCERFHAVTIGDTYISVNRSFLYSLSNKMGER